MASRVDVVLAVDVSLTMLAGLWFLSCFDICGCGLQRDVGNPVSVCQAAELEASL